MNWLGETEAEEVEETDASGDVALGWRGVEDAAGWREGREGRVGRGEEGEGVRGARGVRGRGTWRVRARRARVATLSLFSLKGMEPFIMPR